MAFVAGTISLVSVSSNSAQLAVTPSTGGTGAVTQQWYFSDATGFTPPGAGLAVAGGTGLSVTANNLIPNTVNYFRVIFTDSTAATVLTAQLAVTTTSASQSMNQFAQSPFLGQLDLMVGPTNTYAGQVDAGQTTPVYAGTAMKIVNTTGGIPKFVACTAQTDETWGFVSYDVKSRVYVAGDRFEIATAGSCMWLYATAQTDSGEQVVLGAVSPGSVSPVSGPHTANSILVGRALDQATAYGSLIRVLLESPSHTEIP